MSRRLNDLDPRIRPLVVEFLAQLTEARIPVIIVDTLRTAEEQKVLVERGVSWTRNSLHLPQASGLSLAIDICPYKLFDLHGPDKLQWDASDPVWLTIGEIGERCGLSWGGRWQKRDMGHFEYRRTAPIIAEGLR